MKKYFLLLIILPFLAVSSSAQEVPEVQQSMITKITATWCVNCGTWGWELFEGLVEDNSDKALIIASHDSGDLTNTASEAIAGNLSTSGQPKFYLNNTNQMVTSSMASIRRTEIKNAVDANSMLSPVANTGLDVILDGDQLTVSTKTKFFQATSGTYYVGVYLIENGVINNQSGQPNGVAHKNILRASMSPNVFGELVVDGSVDMGMEFNGTYSMTLSNQWDKEQLTFATIVWKKEGDNYQFVNTHSTTEVGTTPPSTAVREIAPEILQMDVRPNINNGQSQLSLNLGNDQSALSLKVFDQLGRTVKVLHQGEISSGLSTYSIDLAIPGNYFVVAQLEEGVLTKKLIVQ